MNRSVVGVIVALLALGASCDDADLVFELFDPVVLANSSEPAEQAAGAYLTEEQKIERADQAVDEALETKEPERIDRAIELRPRDPEPRVYKAVVDTLLQRGTLDNRLASISDAKNLFDATFDDAIEAERRWVELMIDVSNRVLRAYEGDPDASRYEGLRQAYCGHLDLYTSTFGDSFEGALYLQFVNREPCA